MKIKFSLRASKCYKCLDTCLYFKCCDTVIQNDGYFWNKNVCPMIGSVIEPKFEDSVVYMCEDECPFTTHWHCRNCSADMPLDDCELRENGRPSEDCPVFGMKDGEYEVELKKEKFVRVIPVLWIPGMTRHALSTEDGQKVYDLIYPLMKSGEKVIVDFCDIEVFCTHFLSAALGQLCRDFSKEQINSLLTIKNMDNEHRLIVKRIMENAEGIYKNGN